MRTPTDESATELTGGIDGLLAAMERATPDYRDLYYEWERDQWSAGEVAFADDRRHWHDSVEEQERRALLWALAPFCVGVARATTALVPFVDAAPGEEPQVFLTTQLVDVARHAVFYDRFFVEVLGEEDHDMASRFEHQAGRLNDGARRLLLEMMPEAAERVRRDPADLDALVEGVVLYHLVIEGTLALTGLRFAVNHLGNRQVLPGLRRGLAAVARDESRHVQFGVRLLREIATDDGRYLEVIRSTVDRLLPVAMSAVEPPDGDASYFDALPFGPDDLRSVARRALNDRLRAVAVGSHV